jgi:hypothetical protein
MKKNNKGATILLVLAGLGFISVAAQALYNPQSVMAMVQTELTNTSARNAIRANYGGMNMALGLYMVYAAFKKQPVGLLLLALYTGGFFVGRIAGFMIDGSANTFVHAWAVIEGIFCLGSVWLLRRQNSDAVKTPALAHG